MWKSYLIGCVCVLLLGNITLAQIYGCTDPLANNYNASATHNDGTCLYNAASLVPVLSVTLGSSLTETSGLIRWNSYVWTHNDNTDINLYALDTLTGNIVQTCALSAAVNQDWEEISQDSNYVYIGDFGNNADGNRTDLKILRIEKNSILLNVPVIDTIYFSYADQIDFSPAGANNTDFDCEAFIVTTDSIFLFTKQWVSNKTIVYSLPKTPGTYIANLRDTLNVGGLITGSTYLEPQRLTVLCGYSNMLQPFIYLLYDFTGNDFFGGNKRKIDLSLSFHQTEGIATSDGLKYYISNEYFTQPPSVNTPQKLHTLDLSTYLSGYLTGSPENIPANTPLTGFQIYPNPAGETITLQSGNDLLPFDYRITDISGRNVFSSKITQQTTRIELNNLVPGIYFIRAGQTSVRTIKFVKE